MSEPKTLNEPEKEATEAWNVGPGAWISLVIVLLVFSGFFFKVDGMAWHGWARLISPRLAARSAP